MMPPTNQVDSIVTNSVSLVGTQEKSIWITGVTRSGKTSRLAAYYRQEIENATTTSDGSSPIVRSPLPCFLVFAATGDTRVQLRDRLLAAVSGKYPVLSTTPLGFFLDEIILYWPLLVEQQSLYPGFPTRLRPETEQKLATDLWRQRLDSGQLRLSGVSEYRLVRRLLDTMQLAAMSGTPTESIAEIVTSGLLADRNQNIPTETLGDYRFWEHATAACLQWRDWCWQRGFLTYGIAAELYWRHLLPATTYQQQLSQRYQEIFADDVDEYPAIARDFFETCLQRGIRGMFTFNPDGGVRWGLNADPDYLQELSHYCYQETCQRDTQISLADEIGDQAVQLVDDPTFDISLPSASVRLLSTTSRSQLLQRTADTIAYYVNAGRICPDEIAIIAPGLDAIARYTLTKLLTRQNIPILPLNEQRPLTAVPTVRALLTLLTLLYPGLGRLVDSDRIAEMLVVLTQQNQQQPAIDPVRAGLLADRCFVPDVETPHLLGATVFSRWDRLGYCAQQAYEDLRQWVQNWSCHNLEKPIHPLVALDAAMQKFVWQQRNLNQLSVPQPDYWELEALREFVETANHYMEIAAYQDTPVTTTLADFIQLLRQGTVTANPYPIGQHQQQTAVTLATIFQYRSHRVSHRWHFWLDVGSSLWFSGGSAMLFAAPLFWKHRLGKPWQPSDRVAADQARVRRILRDLLGRVEQRLYLCHSDLSANGQEQNGPLLSLVNAAVSVVDTKSDM